MSSQPVKVRIAPSPTGYLHVGTARMAICNWLFARHNDGEFVIRIEDTDLARSKAEFIDPILDTLKWLGLESDQEIVYQSKRGELYHKYLERLKKTNYSYLCFCTQEDLAAERKKARSEKLPQKYSRKCLGLSADQIQARLAAGDKPVVRLRIPDGETTYQDLVSGTMTRHADDIEDFIVARSDGSVTYNFAVVVDDHDMGITHVFRGNDHATNTFKQVILYNALGLEMPVFGHVPLILRPDKKKVSKRLGDKDAGDYRKEGILPEALINYLSLLGWSPKTDREIYTPDELIAIFTPDNFNPSNAVFDEEKLIAFNRTHLQEKSDHEIAVLLAPMLVEAGLTTKYWLETRWEYLREVVRVLKERARRISDFVTLGSYFFEFDYTYDEKAAAKRFVPEAIEHLTNLVRRFEKLPKFTAESLEAELNSAAEELGVKKGVLIHPTRLSVSGRPDGPGLYDLLVTLGQPIVVDRMTRAIDHIKQIP